MSGIPAFWRVTLTWPKPAGWGKPGERGYVPYPQSSPERFFTAMGFQLEGSPGTLEVAEMRARTVRMVMRMPGQEPVAPVPGRVDYVCSAARAVDWALMVARFGAGCVGPAGRREPLPEPVRVAVEPVARAEA